jgi:DNA mismatch repair protein MutS2
VLVTTVNQQGEVLALPAGSAEAEVQVGNFKLRVRRRELRRLRHVKAAALAPEARPEAGPAVPMEIEVRGWRAEEVPPVIDKYVHDAYLAGLPYIRIIHGKGTGVLRRLVREQLAANQLVKAMQHPEARDGGEGVTVVELAN